MDHKIIKGQKGRKRSEVFTPKNEGAALTRRGAKLLDSLGWKRNKTRGGIFQESTPSAHVPDGPTLYPDGPLIIRPQYVRLLIQHSYSNQRGEGFDYRFKLISQLEKK